MAKQNALNQAKKDVKQKNAVLEDAKERLAKAREVLAESSKSLEEATQKAKEAYEIAQSKYLDKTGANELKKQ